MKKALAILPLVLSLAAPAAAADPQMARALKVDPDRFTLSELVRLYHTPSRDRATVIGLIERDRAAREAEILRVMNGSGMVATRRAN